jgi:hypothetical protein
MNVRFLATAKAGLLREGLKPAKQRIRGDHVIGRSPPFMARL